MNPSRGTRWAFITLCCFALRCEASPRRSEAEAASGSSLESGGGHNLTRKRGRDRYVLPLKLISIASEAWRRQRPFQLC